MTWQGTLKKIDDYRYEIPSDYKGAKGNLKMRTPGLIYASEKLIESIRKDNAPEQVANVATLPGIVGKSMAMPDIHWGYGFPIGGVACMDAEEGVISPGGVGYDINCISGESKILMGDGGLGEIKNVDMGEKVYVFNKEKGVIEKSDVSLILEKQDKIFEVTTKTGYLLRLTLDHPIFTPYGMKKLKYLNVGEFIGTYHEGFKFDLIKKIKPKGTGNVFDMGVSSKHHNFIANNFVVSNCGVRLVKTNLTVKDVSPKIKEIVDSMFNNVPSGVGSRGKIKLDMNQLDEVLENGAGWAVNNGYGWSEDLDYLEENGCMKNAGSSKVSNFAKQRGMPQLGSLGGGNHFLEIDRVDEIYDEKTAKVFGIEHKDQIMVLIHTGSRGCGHQICTDSLKEMERAVKKYSINLPDGQLACAPVNSPEAENYFKSMACGANYAWANRQMIVHWVRESFEKVFNRKPEDLGMHIVYDVCHNIAKLEEHIVDGKRRKLYVHRKGATRAFPKEHPDIPKKYKAVGQPVLIPGDMGTASYVLVGTETGMKETFGSTCHGAGRVMSRHEALRRWRTEDIKREMDKKHIYVHSASKNVLVEEAPDAYKNVDDVVNITDGAGISLKVAKLKPLGVVKG